MRLTEFGRYFRNLRLQHDETLYEAAQYLGCASSYLSAVEHGKRAIPKDWERKIIARYSLGEEEEKKLRRAIELSPRSVVIDCQSATTQQRELAIQFQRSFGDISEEKVDEIMKILGDKKK